MRAAQDAAAAGIASLVIGLGGQAGTPRFGLRLLM
jgi:hypothetical protein